MNNAKAVQHNMILNVLRTLMSVIFPLITYPYITRILQTENYGRVNFGQSVIGYISLIATLGISSYAIRECGIYRSDKKKMQQFTSEIFTINLLTTLLAYMTMGILLLCSAKLRGYALLLLIQSISIFATTLGVDWINVIYEDFLYITLRSLAYQIFSIILMFLLVKEPGDYYTYAGIQVGGNLLIAVTNWFYVRKYCRPRLTYKLHLSRHAKPILILFSNSLAVNIYLNSDKVMLGWIAGDHHVGIYSLAVTIYSVIKQLVAAVYSVTVTRLTEYLAHQRRENYRTLLNSVINNIIMVSVPLTVGMIAVAKGVTLLLFGAEYLEAVLPLQILSVTVLFAVSGGALAYCVNLPMKREKWNLVATAISAAVNILCNLFAIPAWKAVGAALTTLLAEAMVCAVLLIGMKDQLSCFQGKAIALNMGKTLAASAPIVPITLLAGRLFPQYGIGYIGFSVILSAIAFVILNILLKNTTFFALLGGLRKGRDKR